MKFIYVRGGSKQAPYIAQLANAYYGIRADYPAYAPVHMLDVDFHNFAPKQWPKYLAKVYEHRPTMALAPDYGTLPKHTVTRSELYGYIHDLITAGVPEILVCPKFVGAMDHIPLSDHIIVAISVPAKNYAGFVPSDLSKLKGRRIHLLGGNPFRQADLIRKLQGAGAILHSADGNYLSMKAARGQWFDGGTWVQMPSHCEDTNELELYSLKNIIAYLNRAKEQSWNQLI